MEEAINHGRASAVKLYGFLSAGFAVVDPFVAVVDVKRCSGCRMCERACVAKAIKYDEAAQDRPRRGGGLHGLRPVQRHLPVLGRSGLRGYIDNAIDDEIAALVEAI